MGLGFFLLLFFNAPYNQSYDSIILYYTGGLRSWITAINTWQFYSSEMIKLILEESLHLSKSPQQVMQQAIFSTEKNQKVSQTVLNIKKKNRKGKERQPMAGVKTELDMHT